MAALRIQRWGASSTRSGDVATPVGPDLQTTAAGAKVWGLGQFDPAVFVVVAFDWSRLLDQRTSQHDRCGRLAIRDSNRAKPITEGINSVVEEHFESLAGIYYL
jgi:hypothetical protein